MNTIVDYPAFLIPPIQKKEIWTYYCPIEKTFIITDKYDDYVCHTKRSEMGGDRGIHLGHIDNKIQRGTGGTITID